MIWMLTTKEDWSAGRPDIGYEIRVCEGQYPDKVEDVRKLLRQESELKLCRCFGTADEAKQFVSDSGLRLLSPIPNG